VAGWTGPLGVPLPLLTLLPLPALLPLLTGWPPVARGVLLDPGETTGALLDPAEVTGVPFDPEGETTAPAEALGATVAVDDGPVSTRVPHAATRMGSNAVTTMELLRIRLPFVVTVRPHTYA
jgi:hypothetical protein